MQGTSLAGRSILIVEDEPLGAIVLAARSLAEASGLVEHDDLSAAVVDFGLGDHDAGALCVRLYQRCIPFILHPSRTGLPERDRGSETRQSCHADPNRRCVAAS